MSSTMKAHRSRTRFAFTFLACLVGATPACQFSAGQADDGGLQPGEMIVTITDDSAQDFAVNEQLLDGTVATRGALEPDVFIRGGLRARAFRNNHVTNTTVWAEVDGLGQDQAIGFGWGQVPADWGYDRPHGLRMTSSDNFTIVYDGELHLPAGTATFQIYGDDNGFFEIALDGTTYTTPLHSNNNDATSPPIAIAADGWYPIHAAFGENGALARAVLRVNGVAVTADQLRARVTDQRGLVASAYNGRQLLTLVGTSGASTISEDWNGTPDLDLPGLAGDNFGVRYAGQFLVDAAARYTFSADIGSQAGGLSDRDAFRVWVDGELLANAWSPMPVASGSVDLAPGWHDLLADFSDGTGPLRVRAFATTGDTPALFDPTHLRPAVTGGLVASYYGGGTSSNIADVGTISVDLPLPSTPPIPAGAVIDSVDYGFNLQSGQFAALAVTLFDCTAAGRSPGFAMLLAGSNYYYVSNDTTCVGDPPPTGVPWHLSITDTVQDNISAGISYPLLSATYHGGPQQPFAPAFTFLSRVRETPNAVRFGAAHLVADLRGAAAVFSIRTAKTSGALADAAWVDVVDGATPELATSNYVQYRVVVTGDGWQFPSVDKVELAYVAQD
jgi:hypothetical protein